MMIADRDGCQLVRVVGRSAKTKILRSADKVFDNRLPVWIGPILSEEAASQLNGIEVEIDNIYSAYEARSQLDALLPFLTVPTIAAILPPTLHFGYRSFDS